MIKLFSLGGNRQRGGEFRRGGERKKKAVKNLLVSFFLSPRENFPAKIFFFLRHSFSHGPPHFESQELVFFICSGYIMFSFFPAGDMHGRRR